MRAEIGARLAEAAAEVHAARGLPAARAFAISSDEHPRREISVPVAITRTQKGNNWARALRERNTELEAPRGGAFAGGHRARGLDPRPLDYGAAKLRGVLRAVCARPSEQPVIGVGARP